MKVMCVRCLKEGPEADVQRISVAVLGGKELQLQKGGVYSSCALVLPGEWRVVTDSKYTLTFCDIQCYGRFTRAWVDANLAFSHPALSDELQDEKTMRVIERYYEERPD